MLFANRCRRSPLLFIASRHQLRAPLSSRHVRLCSSNQCSQLVSSVLPSGQVRASNRDHSASPARLLRASSSTPESFQPRLLHGFDENAAASRPTSFVEPTANDAHMVTGNYRYVFRCFPASGCPVSVKNAPLRGNRALVLRSSPPPPMMSLIRWNPATVKPAAVDNYIVRSPLLE